MSFDTAIEAIEAIIRQQRESGEQLADTHQQAYLVTVQDAVSYIVACIKEAHRLSKEPGLLSSARGLNHLRMNAHNLSSWGVAFGATGNLVIQDSKTAEIGSALIVFFTEFLATHKVWTSTVRDETLEKIQNLKTNLELFKQDAYRQQLTQIINDNPVAPVDLTFVVSTDASSNWQVTPSVETLSSSDNLSLYQQTMRDIRSEESILRNSLDQLQALQQTLVAIAFPAGAESKQERFEIIREEKLYSIKERINTQTMQLTLLENAYKAIQSAYFQRFNEVGRILPSEREAQLAELEIKITAANALLSESSAVLPTMAEKLGEETPCSLEGLAQKIITSRQVGNEIDIEIAKKNEQHSTKIEKLNDIIKQFMGQPGPVPVLSIERETLIEELAYDPRKDLYNSYLARQEYMCVKQEIEPRTWFVGLGTKARDRFNILLKGRMEELTIQHIAQMQLSTQESSRIQNRTAQLIELAQKQLQVQLHELSYHHHQINKNSIEINFALADIQAEKESLMEFKAQYLSMNRPECLTEYQEVYSKLQTWLSEHAQKITELHWQMAAQNRRQEQANNALVMDALHPLPAELTAKTQQMATLTQTQNLTIVSLCANYNQISELCQWFTHLKLEKMLGDLNTLKAQQADDPKERQRLYLSIKNTLSTLSDHKNWLMQIPTHQSNYVLVQNIFKVEAELCTKQGNLLDAQHQYLDAVKLRFFNDVFPSYLQQRAAKYYWLDAFSKLLGFVLGVFGYKTEAKARTEYLAELKTKWTAFEHDDAHSPAELSSCITKGLQFSPRKLAHPDSLRTKLGLFQSVVEDVSKKLSSETPSRSHQIH